MPVINNQRGFSLIELLVAGAILTVVLTIGIFPMFTTATFLNAVSSQRTIATNLAMDLLENFYQLYQGVGWNSIPVQDGAVGGTPANPCPDNPTPCPPVDPGDGGINPLHRHTFTINGVQYVRVWRVDRNVPVQDVHRVSVCVYWRPWQNVRGPTEVGEGSATVAACQKVGASKFFYCDLGDGIRGRCQ
ncbi:MAG: prepilin-type N-terminal cleavage/methylation domain-containing protein [Deltaproteobacteria bacterium]|nr:prepilin-type N-terminal cleavage/methylation domain-containing protein [Deltaproteobacteria bacterium]